MAPVPGMIRYNTDNAYYERSTDEGTSWVELALYGMTKGQRCGEQTTSATGASTAIQLISTITHLICNNASLLTLQSIIPYVGTGDILVLSAKNAQVDIPHLSGSGTAGYKFSNFATIGITSLAAGFGTAIYVYEGPVGSGLWRLIGHEQGAFITPAFNAGDYTAGTGSWTVGSGDVINYSYYLHGRKLTIDYRWDTTTTATTPSSLIAKIPGGYSAAKSKYWYSVCNNGGTYHAGLSQISASGTTMTFFSNEGGSAWGNGTDNSGVAGFIELEVN